MRIRFTTNVSIPEIPTEVEIEYGTLRDVLLKVFASSHFAREIMDPATGEFKLNDVFELRLNDVPYYALPEHLDTAMTDGDIIALSLILLGGG